MIASEARIAANRANALKSTGPKTDEGKERSRANSYKHGLTGAGVALSTEDAEAVEARFRGFQDSYRPATEAGKELARRAAMLSVRLDRCAVREAAAISTCVRAAEADFDEARAAEVDALFATLEADPAAVRRLRRMPEGVDRMIRTWRDLKADLLHAEGGRFKNGHDNLAIRLTGRKPGAIGIARVEALVWAFRRCFVLLGPEDGAGPEGEDRGVWARRELATLIDAEVAMLEADRATLDAGAVAADRAGAPARALFDPSKEATLARRYEAAAAREMHLALREMKAVEAEAKARAEAEAEADADAAPDPDSETAPLGSSSGPAPARPGRSPSARPSGRFAADPASFDVPMTIGRPAPGRS